MKHILQYVRRAEVLSVAVLSVGVTVFAGTFLEDLAAREDIVASSPFATGGDVILCLSAEKGDYVHVFTNPAAATSFTPSQALYARVMLVAGGGGGGSGYFVHGGGGGAGGLVDANLLLVQDEAVSVKIGGGGARTSGNDKKRGGMGGNTTFGSFTALGGGGGGGFHSGSSAGYTVGLDGGSGGGGGGSQGYDGAAGAGTAGQGHAGGKGTACGSHTGGHGGGGGGAGGKGAGSYWYTATAGDGGAGVLRYILGDSQAFAGGGAGSSCTATQAQGGAGGGGNGSCSTQVDASPGEDGLGGGGGGVASYDGKTYYSGRGGSGLVVVRYRANDAPELTCGTPSARPLSDLSVEISVPYFTAENATAPSVTGTLEYWPTNGVAQKKTVALGTHVASNLWTRVLTCNVKGLLHATNYLYRVTLTNGADASDTAEGSFATLAASCSGVISGIDAQYYIHKAAFDDSDEIFIFTNTTKTATFTPAADGFIRLLLVGGGGAGFSNGKGGACGGGGGGGAGGVIYDSGYFVRAGQDYSISVGAGSAVVAGWNRAANGGDTTFGSLVAFGGGAGGGDRVSGAAGGSGGGGANGNGGGRVRDEAQGHRGGAYGSNTSMAGGGGGAGAVGGDALGTAAGDGGAGATFDITGELVTYAGGGGGGAGTGYSGGAGGLGGGGAGCSGTTPPVAGTDGLGGGGGGGNNGEGSKIYNAARGGSGIVVIRYTDASKLTDAPKFTALYSNVGTTSVGVHVEVTSCGGAAESVSLAAVWGYSADALVHTNVLSSSFSGVGDFTVSGLSPGRGYVMRIVASNAGGGRTEGQDYVFTTVAGLSAKGTISHVIFTYDFGYTVTALGTGTTVAELCVGAQGAEEVIETQSVTATGTFALRHTFPIAVREQMFSYFVRLVNTDGDRSWTNVTAAANFVMDDNASYVFSAPGGSGYWTNATSWTASPTGGVGYPCAEARASFPNNVTSEVLLTENAHPGTLVLTMTDATVIFRGKAEGLRLYPTT